MLRVIVVVMTAATVMLIIAAVFFSSGGEPEKIDRQAYGLYRAGKYEEAAAAWREGVRKFPNSPRLQCGLGTMLAVLKDFPGAMTHLEAAVRLDTSEPRYRKELALCLMQQGRDAQAERELRSVVAAADWFPEAHYYLGVIHERRGERDLALEEYVKELNVNPSCTFAWAKVHSWEKKPSSAQ